MYSADKYVVEIIETHSKSNIVTNTLGPITLCNSLIHLHSRYYTSRIGEWYTGAPKVNPPEASWHPQREIFCGTTLALAHQADKDYPLEDATTASNWMLTLPPPWQILPYPLLTYCSHKVSPPLGQTVAIIYRGSPCNQCTLCALLHTPVKSK